MQDASTNVYHKPFANFGFFSFLRSFPKSVCTSVNEIVCHGIPDYREVQDGDIVNIDISVFNRGGYHGDLNETFCVGNVDDDGKMLVKTAFDSLAAAIDLVKPGTLYRDFGNAIHKVAHKNKCSVVRTYCGHGIGSLFHTIPNVPHYKSKFHADKGAVLHRSAVLSYSQISIFRCVQTTKARALSSLATSSPLNR